MAQEQLERVGEALTRLTRSMMWPNTPDQIILANVMTTIVTDATAMDSPGFIFNGQPAFCAHKATNNPDITTSPRAVKAVI